MKKNKKVKKYVHPELIAIEKETLRDRAYPYVVSVSCVIAVVLLIISIAIKEVH